MNAQQILFSAPMVNALLAGRKTQTRRVVKAPAKNMQRAGMEVIKYRPPGDPWYGDHVLSMRGPTGVWGDYTAERFLSFCPYGGPGDILWARETFSGPHVMDASEWCAAVPPSKWGKSSRIWYWADGNPPDGDWTRPRPSIHMPRWASRITLRITDVRVQRLQQISEEDAIAEGVEGAFVEDGRYWRNYGLSDDEAACSPMLVSPIHSFKSLWESIYGPESWHDDPFVWALTFEVIKANVDAVIAGAAP